MSTAILSRDSAISRRSPRAAVTTPCSRPVPGGSLAAMPKATVDFSKQQFRLPPGPKPTLAGLREAGPWWMAYCNGNAMRPCHHGQPVTLAWALIRWGPEASSDVLRQNLRCSKCGGRGVTIMHPGHHSDRSFKGPGMMPYDDAVRPAQVLGEWGVLGSDRPLRGGER